MYLSIAMVVYLFVHVAVWSGDITWKSSLAPNPPPFLPSVCVCNDTQKQKSGKQGRTGLIHHVNDVSWTWVGRGWVHLQKQHTVIIHLSTEVQDSGIIVWLSWLVKKKTITFKLVRAYIFEYRPLPPLCPSHIHSHDKWDQASLFFAASVYCCERKRKVKMVEVWVYG